MRCATFRLHIFKFLRKENDQRRKVSIPYRPYCNRVRVCQNALINKNHKEGVSKPSFYVTVGRSYASRVSDAKPDSKTDWKSVPTVPAVCRILLCIGLCGSIIAASDAYSGVATHAAYR